MAAGLQITRAALDSISGSLALDFRNWCARVTALQRGATGLTDADLTGLGYTAAEITDIRAAVTNMVKIKNVAQGAATQATASDLTAAMEKLTGIQ